MAISIGALTFTSMQGRPVAPAPAVDAFERIGQHGAEVRLIGQREQDVQLSTLVTAASAAAAQTAAIGQRAIRGTLVTIIDALATSHTNCLIVDCVPRIVACAQATGNPTHTHAILTTWTIRKLYTAP